MRYRFRWCPFVKTGCALAHVPFSPRISCAHAKICSRNANNIKVYQLYTEVEMREVVKRKKKITESAWIYVFRCNCYKILNHFGTDCSISSIDIDSR